MGKASASEIRVGDCRELLRDLPDECIDAIVTDPPYELGFMGKRWDASGIAYDVSVWRECLRVLKPGGHLLAFGGTRTYHRMACAIEDAGFEIRDSLHWIYGSGFPKSMDVSKALDKAAGAEREIIGTSLSAIRRSTSPNPMDRNALVTNNREISITAPATDAAKQWQGWGTALKPAHEPIVVARKPLVGTVAANVLEHGTGALNIDGTRVRFDVTREDTRRTPNPTKGWCISSPMSGSMDDTAMAGRWPPNVLLSHSPECGDECSEDCAVAEMDWQSGTSKSNKSAKPIGKRPGGMGGVGARSGDPFPNGPTYDDAGGASRFFPCFHYGTKAGRKEREAGCESLPPRSGAQAVEREEGSDGMNSPRAGAGRTASEVRNHHPTVKPIEVMRWLVRLVTPPGGLVLDPFAGSGTTGVACVHEGFDFVGFEQLAEYAEIAKARIHGWQAKQVHA